MIPDSTITEIKNRIDIEEVVSDFVSLKRKGQNLWANCPFHNEKTPSFSVNPAKGFYKCFGCGAGGDAIDFVMEVEKINYLEAIRWLGKKYGVEIQEEELSEEDLKAQSERESLYIVLNFAKDYFVNNLKDTNEGKSVGHGYFKERDFTDDIVEKFEFGFSQDKWDGLLTHAKEAGHSNELLEKAGLIIAKDDRFYDRFRGRVIFPIHNVSGRVVAFGARALKKDDKPKYINSPETPVYHKSQVLYGLFQARQAIRQQQNCYLVEGYTDVNRLHQIGIENVVASSGTSLTSEQVQLVSRFSKQLTVLYDGDTAGLQASIRGIDIILANGLDVKVVLFPEGHDPDSYAQELGANEFKNFLDDKTEDFIHFRLNLLVKEAGNDPVKKAGGIKDVVSTIAQIPDQVKRTVYIKEASNILQMEERVLFGEMNKALIKASKSRSAVPDYLQPPEEPAPPQKEHGRHEVENSLVIIERSLLRLLLEFGTRELDDGRSLTKYIFDELEDLDFIDQNNTLILNEYKSKLNDDTVIDAQYFIKQNDSEIRKIAIELVHERRQVSDLWMKKYKIFIPTEADKDVLERIAYILILRYKKIRVGALINDNLELLKEAKTEQEKNDLQLIHQEWIIAQQDIAKKLGNVVSKI